VHDFAYDVRERKNLARQARYRKNGSKSKKCTLPHEGITQAQWKRMNGEVFTVNLNTPCTWEQFRDLSPMMQKDYLVHLRDTYGVRQKEISEMFGVSRTTVKNLLTEGGVSVEYKLGRYGMTPDQQQAWHEFLGVAEEPAEQIEEVSDEPEAEITAVNPDAKPAAMSMRQFSLVFDGALDVNAIANSLLHILGPDAAGQIEIKCMLASQPGI